MENSLMTLREVARKLSLSPSTLRTWTFQKRIPFVRLGRRIAFRNEDVEKLIERNLVESEEV
ncbi:MAG: helix-turn-helix domain-containing protein [Deltaproteobacteria bacterium]|nr:helix-turn-helix domain-containing protein [Deltaproteobacteria bacterium]